MKAFENKEQTSIAGDYRVDYIHLNKDCKSDEVLVFLHGFGESADIYYEQVKDILPSDVEIIMPNGIFPIPKKLQDTYDIRFAWYFYDNKKDYYFVKYDVPANVVNKLLVGLGIDRPVTFVGFSQGGYLAPFCGMAYKHTKEVAMINASLRLEKGLKEGELPDFPVHCLNGDCDVLVDPKLARERFDKCVDKGMKGSFSLVSDTKHEINDPIRLKLKELLKL